MPEKMTAVLAGTMQRAPYCPHKSTFTKTREPVRRTTGRVVGRYPSFKNNRMISWESQLEHKACVLFEFSSAVLAYREQPETIRFWHQGKWCRYTPDFCIETFGGRSTYIEVKPEKYLADATFLARLQDISIALATGHIGFGVLTDKELTNTTLQLNLKILRQPLRSQLSTSTVRTATEYLAKHEDVIVGDLAEVLGDINLVYSLIAQQYLKTDLTKSLCRNSTISLMEDEDYESFLFTCRYAPDFV